MALANVVAMGTAAPNLVLIGDQMQLGQPVQAVHPGESGASVLDFLFCRKATVSPIAASSWHERVACDRNGGDGLSGRLVRRAVQFLPRSIGPRASVRARDAGPSASP